MLEKIEIEHGTISVAMTIAHSQIYDIVRRAPVTGIVQQTMVLINRVAMYLDPGKKDMYDRDRVHRGVVIDN